MCEAMRNVPTCTDRERRVLALTVDAAVYIVMLGYPYESASPWAVYSSMELAAACVAEGGNPYGSYLEIVEMRVDESLPGDET